ncbi:hypothetical protein RT723_13575 [Psychrosphaera aquimarina]|uniref:Tyr recombinase domain-containing protein n=1 Tax=Psychrosphaera aquimarina TaxID=2044854 RepID=A0ABU3R2X2_9GAMM|nr:hypothetical protein [Psychrosphaera aquimarina]MDU0114011.1 hypothetical protein [Psychrosphaera aquimarina]
MLRRVKDNKLNTFWEEQNTKLLAHENFLNEYGDIYSDKLYFRKSNGGKTELDFSIFEMPHLNAHRPARLNIGGACYSLSMAEYVKLSVVCAVVLKRTDLARIVYQFNLDLAGFFKLQECNLLVSKNVESFHLNFLTNRFNRKGMFARLSAPAHNSTYGYCNLMDQRDGLHSIGVSGVVDVKLTSKMYQSALNNVCKSLMGITLSEYKKGSSLNFLTLEIGQYYMDYLRGCYEDNYFYTLICKRSISKVYKNIGVNEGENKSAGSVNLWRLVILDTIRGTYQFNKKSNTTGLNSDELHYATKLVLFSEYQNNFEKVMAVREKNILMVVRELGLESRFDAVEVIRLLMLQKYLPFNASKEPEDIWIDYLSSLSRSTVDSHKLNKVTVENIYELMRKFIDKQRLDEVAFFNSLQLWFLDLVRDSRVRGIVDFTFTLERVADAMTCLIVGWLGYRKSEYGFPLSAIHAEPNLDILDNSHIPFRFKLKWVVPKTNGSSKLDREITSQCYQVASELNVLFQPPNGGPCLYKSSGLIKKQPTSNQSGVYLEMRVKSNWFIFVQRYKPFNDVLELDRLSMKKNSELSLSEKQRFTELSHQYDLSSARGKHLLESSKALREGIVILNCTYVAGSRALERFKNSLIEYQQTGDISNLEHKKVVENYLSAETKVWLSGSNSRIDRRAMKSIATELLRCVNYPTPHAFRHIWAEAVLMRYQGDVGAAIRHQFCHMDDSFFMAYLRDKEAKSLISVARPKVLNTIIDTLLIEHKAIGLNFLGGIARFVGKSVSMTQVVTPSEFRALREQITRRVISVNSAQYATCIPREGTESRAKCAEFGGINPHNAKLAFCLDCTNALVTEGNLRGIWEVIQPFIKESLHEDVMGFMVQHHLPTIRSAEKRVKEMRLDSNAEKVDKMLYWFSKAIESIETKLYVEEELHG